MHILKNKFNKIKDNSLISSKISPKSAVTNRCSADHWWSSRSKRLATAVLNNIPILFSQFATWFHYFFPCTSGVKKTNATGQI